MSPADKAENGTSHSRIKVRRFIDIELFGATSNLDILAQDPGIRQSTLPNSRTYIYEKPREKVGGVLGLMYRLDPIRFHYLVQSHQQLHSSFDASPYENEHNDRTIGLYDVYAVTRPDMLHRALLQSVHHWSLYCNGHYYHLTKSQKIHGAQTILKDEDLSYPESIDYLSYRTASGGPLLAYHLGKTDYTPEQIHKIAEWVVERLSVYDLFSSNCQHFVLCLAVRILCCRRNTAVFMGHTLQIVEQDRMKNGADPSRVNTKSTPMNGFYTGFQLAGPEEKIGSRLQQFVRKTMIEFDSYQLNYLWADGVEGKLPHNILEYSRWRRQLLLLPRFNTTLFKLRTMILRSTSDPQATKNGTLTLTSVYTIPSGLSTIIFHHQCSRFLKAEK